MSRVANSVQNSSELCLQPLISRTFILTVILAHMVSRTTLDTSGIESLPLGVLTQVRTGRDGVSGQSESGECIAEAVD